ncbi:MAG: GGDEF domain-containing protein [Erysipelotrichaceae bacterium]|nr:GGDEF domain-containing protein [Erysipelotrichaceae bacterium]
MKKMHIAIMFVTFTTLGALFGLILHSVLISARGNFLIHCLLIGGVFGLLNSITSLYFLRKNNMLVSTNLKLDLEIRKDKLTDLFNRKAFDYDLNTIYLNEVCSVIFLDVDNFRDFNNVYGHQVGDNVLIECARIIKSCIRESDMSYRYGGEEFIVILRNCIKKEAGKIAQNIVKNISCRENGSLPMMTISAGVSSMPEDASTIEQIVRASDLALISAKKLGKNQVVLYEI